MSISPGCFLKYIIHKVPVVITAYGIPLAPVTSFKYLVSVLSVADDDWPAVINNLWRAWHKWARLTWVLSTEGMYSWNLDKIYLAVVHSVMLYGSETWFVTPCIGRVVGRIIPQGGLQADK